MTSLCTSLDLAAIRLAVVEDWEERGYVRTIALYVYTEGGRFPRSCGVGAALCVSHRMAVEEDHLAGYGEGTEGVPRSDTSNIQG